MDRKIICNKCFIYDILINMLFLLDNMTRSYNIAWAGEEKVIKKRHSGDLKRIEKPWCPHCFGGEIYYDENQGLFVCNKCGESVEILTKDGKGLNVTVKR